MPCGLIPHPNSWQPLTVSLSAWLSFVCKVECSMSHRTMVARRAGCIYSIHICSFFIQSSSPNFILRTVDARGKSALRFSVEQSVDLMSTSYWSRKRENMRTVEGTFVTLPSVRGAGPTGLVGPRWLPARCRKEPNGVTVSYL